jgi:PTH1 family peptidyl-tRNA hydrolase
MTEWLIVGLGNPGREYELNRHNIGFLAVDQLVEKYGSGNDKNAFQSVVRSGSIDGTSVLFLKPQTYMNLSGEAVGAAARFYKIPIENIIVLHDELDLAASTIRIRQGGGSAGHNGLKSIDQHAGNNFWRIRMGIGHPGDKDRVTGHVLGNFHDDEFKWLEPLLKTLTDNFPLMLSGQSAKLASKFTPAPAPKKEE